VKRSAEVLVLVLVEAAETAEAAGEKTPRRHLNQADFKPLKSFSKRPKKLKSKSTQLVEFHFFVFFFCFLF
jgi:hypothetical protein